MNKELKEALKLISEKCKEKTYKEFSDEMKSNSLLKKISTLKTMFIMYVDFTTINYKKTQHYKKHPDRLEKEFDVSFKEVELSKSEKEKAIREMEWFINDIEACIAHLKNN